jgi:hypothetical protein
MRGGMLVSATIGVLLAVASPAKAQRSRAVPQGRVASADSNPACCSVVRIDSAKSIVTVRELATGFTFAFTVRSRRLLRTVRIGRPVWADFTKKTVKLNASDTSPCCDIIPAETP